GAVETLIAWENLDILRVVTKNPITEEKVVRYLSPAQESNRSNYVGVNPETGAEVDLETIQKCLLLEWLAEHYKTFGANLEIVTDRSQEGSQFVRGFGGFGGFLRYKVDIHEED